VPMQSERREIKVLHVDDEPDFLLITKHNLEKKYANFSIDTATSAEEGITLLNGGKYDVVVSDYQMPGMNGLEFLQNLRASGDKIPFIMFTGRGREEVAIEALNKGANHYLQKGGDITSLYKTLAHVIIELADRKRAEEKVVEIEKEHQIILDALPLNIFHINRDNKFVHVNEVLAERYGLKPKDFKDKTSRDFFPDVGEAYIESDKAVFESGTRQIGTIRKIVTPQGEKWVRLDKVPLKDDDGNVTGVIGFELDITEQEQAEETLRESEKKLSQIVLGSPIPAFVIDHRHVITHWNTACEQLTGFSAAEMVGTKKQWLAFYPEERPVMSDFVVDEQPEEVITSFYADKYQKSEFIEGAYEALDFFPSLKDSGKWLFFTATPLRDSKGHSTGALETLQDVTGLKSAEEALRESEAKYRGLAENLQDGLFILQGYPYPELKFCNDAFAKMVGYTVEEMMALTIQ